ncbi:MAG: DNA methyltransferase [bacterium]|nr:DNA methyltransferase [bacterium]
MRIANDFYPTPTYTVKSLIDCLDLRRINSFLEPCKGNGSIYNSVEVPDKHYCELLEGINYLTTTFEEEFDLIVTNPPYSLAQQFLEKSLSEAKTVCYLLRINFLGSQKRKDWWKRITPPNKLLVLSKRPKFVNNKSDRTEYAWYCWDNYNVVKSSEGIHIL